MIKNCFVISFLLITFYGSSQSQNGITGKPDTSYTIYSAAASISKTNPEARVANELHSPSLAEEKNITYCHVENRNLLLDAFYSKQESKEQRIAIIIIHGGGWRAGDRTLHYPLAQHLAEMGYVCFTPEYRLSPEVLYPAGVFDIKSAIRWVRNNAAKYYIDPGKIVVAGHSAGGELAAMMGATNDRKEFEGDGCDKVTSSKVNAVIDLDGLLAFIHPESGEGDDSKRISAATAWFGYSKAENPELWKYGSPLTHIGAHTPPTLFINSNAARMHAGRDDYVKILDEFSVYTEVKTFDAPHLFPLFEPWFTPMLKTMDSFSKKVFKNQPRASLITVAQDGTGSYTSVQAALNAIPSNNKMPFVIYIRNGIYKEKLLLDSTKKFITLLGEDKFKTILTYNDHTGKLSPSGDTINTRTSWSFKILSDDFTAKDITFQNEAGFTAGQAVAVESDGDKAGFYNCRFIGNQDVLFTNNDKSRQYYENCYIEGTTDFIFGSATAWFEKCHIHSKKNSHVTAASLQKKKSSAIFLMSAY
jgi:pectinesterase